MSGEEKSAILPRMTAKSRLSPQNSPKTVVLCARIWYADGRRSRQDAQRGSNRRLSCEVDISSRTCNVAGWIRNRRTCYGRFYGQFRRFEAYPNGAESGSVQTSNQRAGLRHQEIRHTRRTGHSDNRLFQRLPPEMPLVP